MKSKGDIFHHRELGELGERLAREYLESKSYKILHTNWHHGHKELDIVTQYNETIVVVEVKTRASDYWEEPKDAVRLKKQRRIIDAADAYVQNQNIDLEVRFDIVSILFEGDKHTIEHIEDAFYPTL